MSWRVIVISTRAKLDLQLGYMVVRGERTTKVHLDEISVLLIETTQVSLTAALLAEMMDRKIKVIFAIARGILRLSLFLIMERMMSVLK